jgi:hypothetical protein
MQPKAIRSLRPVKEARTDRRWVNKIAAIKRQSNEDGEMILDLGHDTT